MLFFFIYWRPTKKSKSNSMLATSFLGTFWPNNNSDFRDTHTHNWFDKNLFTLFFVKKTRQRRQRFHKNFDSIIRHHALVMKDRFAIMQRTKRWKMMEALKMIQRLMFEVLSSRQRCHVGRRSHDSELRDKNPVRRMIPSAQNITLRARSF